MSATTDAPRTYAVSIDDVRAARERISGLAHVTPVLTCETLDLLATEAAKAAAATNATPVAPPLSLFFKCEQFQRVGAFKFRGAVNATKLALEQAADPSRLVLVTHSSGNHAQALALASRSLGVRCIVVMPDNAPGVKVRAVLGYGAEVVRCASNQNARESAAADQLALHAPHALLVPPYEHAHVIAGQGTVALELLEQVAELDAIVVPVGGGGLLAGVCIAAKAVNPRIRIYAAEPRTADDAFQSITSGIRTPLPAPTNTVADGLRTSLGGMNFDIIRDHVSGVILVEESDIVQNMKLIFERMKVVTEASSAVCLAALRSSQFYTFGPSAVGPLCRDNNPLVVGVDATLRDKPIQRVGIVLSGGNVDLDALPWLVGEK